MNSFQALQFLASSLLSRAHWASSNATRKAQRNAPFKKRWTVLMTLALSLRWNSSKLAMPMATLHALTSNSTGAPVDGGSSISSTSSSGSEVPLSDSTLSSVCTPPSAGGCGSQTRLNRRRTLGSPTTLAVSDTVLAASSSDNPWSSAPRPPKLQNGWTTSQQILLSHGPRPLPRGRHTPMSSLGTALVLSLSDKGHAARCLPR